MKGHYTHGSITVIQLAANWFRIKIFAPGYINGEYSKLFVGYNKREAIAKARHNTGTVGLRLDYTEI